MSDETPDIETPATPDVAPEKTAPKSLEELVASIDIADVTIDQIFRELIQSIMNVATAAQIALGIAERIRLRDLAAESASEEAPVVTPEFEVV
jgi:hypothetical protein